MSTEIELKKIITLVLSIVLAVGSYWIPLPSTTTMQDSESSEMASLQVN